MLFEYNNKSYAKDDIIAVLNSLGVKNGDTICVHSELFKFGSMSKAKNDFLAGIIAALSQSIGANDGSGTLLIPTFTYKFCQNKIYDKNNTKCEVGVLGEYFRKFNGVLRSNDPIFNFAILGKNKNEYNLKHDSCFGKNSAFEMMVKNNAKIITFGSINIGYTLAHYIEEILQVPYRYYKDFNGIIIDKNGEQKPCLIKYFVRKLDEKRTIFGSQKVIDVFLKEGVLKVASLGGGQIGAMEAKDFFDVTLEYMKKDPYCFLLD